MKRPVILTIIDGLGLRKATQGNAFKLAKTPTFDDYFANYPWTVLQASGQSVGLPNGQMGNSEVGHLNIGAGQVVYTGLSLISAAIKADRFATNAAFVAAFQHAKVQQTTLHLIGLLSPGGVHAHEMHLFHLLDAAYAYGLKKVSVHVFGDGRDVAPRSIAASITKLAAKLARYDYHLASISGRFYAMDRDQMFERVTPALAAICGRAKQHFTSGSAYVAQQYAQNVTDEFFEPAINVQPDVQFLNDHDALICFNFRPDRMRQLAHLIVGSTIYDHPVTLQLPNIVFVTMMKYEGINALVAFQEMRIANPIGKVLAAANLTQLRLAETQKYAHVTFFMDGGQDLIYPHSKRIMVPSLKVTSYADAPQMSAAAITDQLIANWQQFDVIIMNFANPDMVGHTGNLEATISAIELLDAQLARIKSHLEKTGGVQFITADHGNAELTENAAHEPSTKHTSSPVMLICSDQAVQLQPGKLANIAPTILDYMQIKQPASMNEKSLIKSVIITQK